MARASSRQTQAVLGQLGLAASAWQHGYELCKATALKSGTLYPILARLTERGLLETTSEAEQPTGRPRRHLYSLTPDGIAELSALKDRRSEHETEHSVRLLRGVGHAV